MTSVCLVNLNAYCLFNPASQAPMGGAELDIYTLAYGLKSQYHVTVVTGDWGQLGYEVYDGITVMPSVSFRQGGYARNIFRLWQALHNARADTYLSTGAGVEVGIISLFCLLHKKKYIYRTAHDMDCNGDYIARNGIRGLVYQFGLKRAHAIVTSVIRHRELLTNRYPHLITKITQINLGMLIPRSDKKPPQKTYILWVARCETWKNPNLFLDLVETLPKQKFVMICPPQPHIQVLFDQVMARAQGLPNVTFIPSVPFKDIQSYFDNAKLFVNTSDSEGFTYTLIQSGIARTPVVYFAVNPDDVITTNALGSYAGGNKKKFLTEIRLILSNDIQWRKASRAIHRYVTKYHDIHVLVQKWVTLIQ